MHVYYYGHNVLEEAIYYGSFDSLSCKQMVWKYNNLEDSWIPLCNKDNRCAIYIKYWTIALSFKNEVLWFQRVKVFETSLLSSANKSSIMFV